MGGWTRSLCFILLLGAAAGCAVSPRRVDGIIIPDPGDYPQVAGALALLRTGEPALYGLLKKHVVKIDISPIYEMSSPFYDYIYLAPAALERGAGYTASVIGHELLHVVINGVRRKVASPADLPLLGFPELAGAGVPKLAKEKEEGMAYGLQEKLLVKYGTEADIEYHRLRMKALHGKK